MLAGITMLISFVVVSPFDSKYYLMVDEIQAVSISLIVTSSDFAVFLISSIRQSLLQAALLIPLNNLFPS
jgi:hypothetical protein